MVNLAIALTDTGERKPMFGFTARRVKSTMTRQAGPGTCDPGNDTIETDGWYIDYMPEGAATPAAGAGRADRHRDRRIYGDLRFGTE